MPSSIIRRVCNAPCSVDGPVGQARAMANESIPVLTFPRRVIMVVARVPRGRVTTYGRIAAALGSPRASHVVGSALAHLPTGHDLPAHRVVNRVGYLSGAEAWGNPEIMRDLLREEGVPFRAEWKVDLDACVWDPADDPALDGLFRGGQEALA